MGAYGLQESIEILMCSASVNVTRRRIRRVHFDSNIPDTIARGTPDTERELFVPNVQFNGHRHPADSPGDRPSSENSQEIKSKGRGAAGITYSSPAALRLC